MAPSQSRPGAQSRRGAGAAARRKAAGTSPAGCPVRAAPRRPPPASPAAVTIPEPAALARRATPRPPPAPGPAGAPARRAWTTVAAMIAATPAGHSAANRQRRISASLSVKPVPSSSPPPGNTPSLAGPPVHQRQLRPGAKRAGIGNRRPGSHTTGELTIKPGKGTAKPSAVTSGLSHSLGAAASRIRHGLPPAPEMPPGWHGPRPLAPVAPMPLLVGCELSFVTGQRRA
jgi:hypothetical protein